MAERSASLSLRLARPFPRGDQRYVAGVVPCTLHPFRTHDEYDTFHPRRLSTLRDGDTLPSLYHRIRDGRRNGALRGVSRLRGRRDARLSPADRPISTAMAHQGRRCPAVRRLLRDQVVVRRNPVAARLGVVFVGAGCRDSRDRARTDRTPVSFGHSSRSPAERLSPVAGRPSTSVGPVGGGVASATGPDWAAPVEGRALTSDPNRWPRRPCSSPESRRLRP